MIRFFNHILRFVFFALFIRPLVFVFIGLSIRDRDKLPSHGPAIMVANHNSHLDTMVMMSLFPMHFLPKLRPVAAADYFLKSGWMSWFSKEIIGVIPISRQAREEGEDPFAEVSAALGRGEIVILFPEGTRGAPEQMQEIKKGISHLVADHPEVPVVPVFFRGLGKAMPKGSWLPVPFFCDVLVGDRVSWPGDREGFMENLRGALTHLSERMPAAVWD